MKTEKELKKEIERRIIDFANEDCRSRLRKQGHEVLDDYEYYKLKYGGGFIRAINKAIDLTLQERNAEVKQIIKEIENSCDSGNDYRDGYADWAEGYERGWESVCEELLQKLGLDAKEGGGESE